MSSSVDIAQQSDLRSSARTTSKDDLGFTAPLVSVLRTQLAPSGCGVPVKPSLENSIKITEEHISVPKKTRIKKEKKEVPTCSICVEPYNRSSRFKIICEYCPQEACTECCKRYVLQENEPKCMSGDCNRQWTHEFISKIFSKKFVATELKFHYEKVLFDKQRALLPATQPLVENILKREDYARQINAAAEVVTKARLEMNKIQSEYYRFTHTDPNTQERAAFIRACPSPDCHGFLSSQWKCGLCNIWTCPTCHEIKGSERDGEHTCNPDNIATANLLNSDTKPCPKCGEGIFKINGCDQMYCVSCHTAFSWRTGRIETNAIHNPHYFEWMRLNGTLERNPNDVICGRELNHNTTVLIRNLMVTKETIYPENAAKIKQYHNNISEVCRKVIHFRYVSIPNYQYNSDRVTQELRIRYMRNYIDENQFKTLLQKDYKKSNKYREILEVIQLLTVTITDIVLRFIDEIKDPLWTHNLERMNEINEIIKYADECFLKISRTYNSIPLTFKGL